MQFNKDNVELYNIAKSEGLRRTNFLTWSGIRRAIPAHIKTLDVNVNEINSLKFHYEEKIFDPVNNSMNLNFRKNSGIKRLYQTERGFWIR